MAVEPPQVRRERVVRALRRRVRPWARLGGQLIWAAAFLIGGAIASAEGDQRTGLVGLVMGGIFLLATLLAALRRRRLRRHSWRAS